MKELKFLNYLGGSMENLHPPILEKYHLKTFGTRLGKILSNLSIAFFVVSLCGIFSFLSTSLILLFGFILIIISVGTIFIAIPNYWNILETSVDISSQITEFFTHNFYVFVSFALVLSVLSIVILKIDRTSKHTSRVVTSSIILALSIVAIILIASGVSV